MAWFLPEKDQTLTALCHIPRLGRSDRRIPARRIAHVNQQTPDTQTLTVYAAEAFRVAIGANMGDGVSICDDLAIDDIYALEPDAQLQRIALVAGAGGQFRLSVATETGTPGHHVHLDCVMVLMSPDGVTQDAIVLAEVDGDGGLAAVHLLPLAPLDPKVEYTLVGTDRDGARTRFAQFACASFAHGTHVTMSTGEQRRVEDLKVGDRLLTRDDGPQPIRWIGHSTIRAVGAFAPILIEAGALNNAHDLLVSPDHRLFVYQRSDRIGAGQSEVLVKARLLVNGNTVRILSGGFIDYYQILFDRHHIIYAEGIAAESMLVDPRTRPVLPADVQQRMGDAPAGHGRGDRHGLDVEDSLLDRPDAVDMLKLSSLR